MLKLRLIHVFYLAAGLASSGIAHALTLQVIGVNHQVVFQKKITKKYPNVGELTHTVLNDALKRMAINEYVGSSGGVSSINQMGNQIEVISDREMNAFGWCYHVDAQAPDLMPDQYLLRGTEKTITWFYAYAHLKNDQWLSMCSPADHFPASHKPSL